MRHRSLIKSDPSCLNLVSFIIYLLRAEVKSKECLLVFRDHGSERDFLCVERTLGWTGGDSLEEHTGDELAGSE